MKVSKGDYDVSGPSVAVDGKGGVVVAWTQDSAADGGRSPLDEFKLRYPLTIRARIRARTGAWGKVHRLGTTGHFHPDGVQAAANAAGDAIVLWGGVHNKGEYLNDPIQSSFRLRQGRSAACRRSGRPSSRP